MNIKPAEEVKAAAVAKPAPLPVGEDVGRKLHDDVIKDLCKIEELINVKLRAI